MRVWHNRADSDDSIHCLSNGRLCAYGLGPQLIQVFGPPFSSPSLYHLDLVSQARVRCDSEREGGSAIWTHRLTIEGQPSAEWVDFVDSGLPVLVRRIETRTPLQFKLSGYVPLRWVENGDCLYSPAVDGGILLETPAGQYLYHTYPFPTPIFHQIAWRGEAAVTINGDANTADLLIAPGEFTLYLCGGPSYPEAIQHAEAALSLPYAEMLGRTRCHWAAFTGRRSSLTDLPRKLPLRDALIQAADDVAVLIKAQQAQEGCVLAGYTYRMGYVRDQYGVSRGLLTLGLAEEARQILAFYWHIWQRHGRIHNAQAAGVDGVFHVHENDQVEITGYLIRQAFDWLKFTAEDEFIQTIFPMLEWAWEAQKANLVEDMLPFNGDETYVAGGILPRSTLNHGSAEATLLFVDSGEKLLDWVQSRAIWGNDRIEKNQLLLRRVRDNYRRHFWQDGWLITNNPKRACVAKLPRFRHGVCERCLVEMARPIGVMWTERDADGRYLCPECLAKGSFAKAENRSYRLQSVSLTPIYFHASLFQPQELAPSIEAIAHAFQTSGRLPSRPDDSTGISVGYDYGFLLYALTELRHPLAKLLYERTLGLLDAAGAWAEYYLNGEPRGTRCRPWESAINLEAAIHWARSWESEQ